MIHDIQWLGHSSFILRTSPSIALSPWRIAERGPADFILIGHEHYDHFSPPDIQKLRGPRTRIVANERIAQLMDGVTVLRPWQSLAFNTCRITAVPAYSPNDPRHPQERGDLGFLISLDDYDLYYAGDTDLIPEMSRLHPDVVILPIDDNGTLSVERAAQAVSVLRPSIVIPCNWANSGRVNLSDALRLQRLVAEQAKVIFPQHNQLITTH
ncbi:MAG: MBL fold metallo-hydrolase [Anaerolineae bacterium]|nr:MBL fold metallo-hydrolase [Anaerolineae bacterium]MDW8171349.1 MBL fold metallo-hydrolase [Anaerolineae bacterium]